MCTCTSSRATRRSCARGFTPTETALVGQTPTAPGAQFQEGPRKVAQLPEQARQTRVARPTFSQMYPGRSFSPSCRRLRDASRARRASHSGSICCHRTCGHGQASARQSPSIKWSAHPAAPRYVRQNVPEPRGTNAGEVVRPYCLVDAGGRQSINVSEAARWLRHVIGVRC